MAAIHLFIASSNAKSAEDFWKKAKVYFDENTTSLNETRVTLKSDMGYELWIPGKRKYQDQLSWDNTCGL
jgi:hypothetical protein